MKLRFVPVLLLLVAAFALPGTTSQTRAEEGYTLRIASLAPAGSSWMKVLNAWNKTLIDKTGGRLKMRFYPGGSQGDERDFVRKMRVGQLDGGVVTMTGMSMLVPAMNVLTLPGFLDTYEKLDRVRDRMAGEFEAILQVALSPSSQMFRMSKKISFAVVTTGMGKHEIVAKVYGVT